MKLLTKTIYPTLLELCGLPAYERNEGESLLCMMEKEGEAPDSYAITTFGMNNHAVRKGQYCYIRYEDGMEEFYDYNKDPNEWTNQANNPEYKKEIEALSQYLPKHNANWDTHSNYKFQPYFVEQKERTSLAISTSLK